MFSDAPHRFTFRQPELGVHPIVEVDGVDVAEQLSAFRIDADPRGKEVTLWLTPGTVPEFDGLARVRIAEPAGPDAVEFLAAIDAEQLETAALNRDDLDPKPGGLTRAMLAQLVEWASGGGLGDRP